MNYYIKYKKLKSLYKELGGTLIKCRNRNYQEITSKLLDKHDITVQEIGKSNTKRYIKLGILNDKYDRKEFCGKGSYKKVYLAIDTLKNRLVIWYKIMVELLEPYIRKLLINEIKVLEKCNSKYIISFYGSSFNKNNNSVNFWTEYAKNGDLGDIIESYRLGEKVLGKKMIINYLYRTLVGLNYLHQLNIIHCDIKPDNILLCRNIYDSKISDFGLVLVGENGQEARGYYPHGTPAFWAPEVIGRSQEDIPYDYKVDIYSLGYFLYNLVSLKTTKLNNENKTIIYNKYYKKIQQYKKLGYYTNTPKNFNVNKDELETSDSQVKFRINLSEYLERAISDKDIKELERLLKIAINLNNYKQINQYTKIIDRHKISIDPQLKDYLINIKSRYNEPRDISFDPISLQIKILEKELEGVPNYQKYFHYYDYSGDNEIEVNGISVKWNPNRNFLDFFIDCIGYTDDRLDSGDLLKKYFII